MTVEVVSVVSIGISVLAMLISFYAIGFSQGFQKGLGIRTGSEAKEIKDGIVKAKRPYPKG